jgi:hypothetical protein
MKTFARVLFSLLVLNFSGCLPEERFWWSPDGTQAAVLVNDQIHLARADGELGAALVASKGLNPDLPKRVSWLRDGSGVVVNRVHNLATWEEMRALVSAEEAAQIERLASAIPALLQTVPATEAGSLKHLLAQLSVREKASVSPAFHLAHARQKTAVETALRGFPRGVALLEEVQEETMPFQVHELCLIQLRDARPDGEATTLARSVTPLLWPLVSPKFAALAYGRFHVDGEKLALEVCTLDGKEKLTAAWSTSAAFDWAADGRSLVFASPTNGDDSLLQTIQRVTVLQESGALMKPRGEDDSSPRELASSVDLAVAIFPSPPRLAALPDGRVLFASVPAKFPVVSKGLEVEPRLFLISADGLSVAPVPTKPGDLPTNLSFFAVSPDGQRVAVVESGTDAVAVVELATGRTEIVSAGHQGSQCRTLPGWKSATELSFAARALAKGEPRWMLWTPGLGVRSLSDKWPAGATQKWLEQKKEDEAPGKTATP